MTPVPALAILEVPTNPGANVMMTASEVNPHSPDEAPILSAVAVVLG
jgi:hypothetical protein